ncbi:hypothetical protein CANMA_002224 [Candida margitis]|uniref:uncharacterized protein n=1 Tax=Candida margitis TaxID=1775924 RepID=UPI002227BE5E|nr:uncharacterized protein CANMA_002224 [Candida margitis]KAI5968788.1 hypothetical protein CANMA_002224 [Candida margitis]
MYRSSIVIVLTCIFNVISAIGFSGVIKNIPNDVPELGKELRQTIPNLNNYASRVKVDLYKLNDKGKNHDFSPVSATVGQNYQFKYKDLSEGEYELIINSYDFAFANNRYRLLVDEGKVSAYEDPLGQSHNNQSLAVEVSHQTPLEIQFREVKQFYEKSGGSVFDMVLNSPFGFIFRNKTYTIIFIVLMTISVAPTIAQWVNPEFAEQFKEVQAEVAQSRLQKSEATESQEVLAVAGSTGAKRASGTIKKRR